MKYFLSSIMAVLLLVACKNEGLDLRPYYFPIDELAEGMVYEYQSPMVDSVQFPPFFWYYRTVEDEAGEEFFIGVNYNLDYEVEQLIREREMSDGMRMEDVRIYEGEGDMVYDIQAEIVQSTAFFFKSDTTKILPYQLHWPSQIDTSVSTTLTRGRRFVGLEQHEVGDKMYDCAKFLSDEIIEIDDKIEGGQILELKAVEWYARGIGIVKTQKTVEGFGMMTYELTDRYSMQELEAKIQAK